MTDLRRDGAAALEWAAQYLERVGELPVLAGVKPGEVRARLPASPPDEPEPFSAVLRDLDELYAEAVDLDHRIEHHLRRLRAIAGGEPSARQVSRPPEKRSGRRPDGNSRANARRMAWSR